MSFSCCFSSCIIIHIIGINFHFHYFFATDVTSDGIGLHEFSATCRSGTMTTKVYRMVALYRIKHIARGQKRKVVTVES